MLTPKDIYRVLHWYGGNALVNSHVFQDACNDLLPDISKYVGKVCLKLSDEIDRCTCIVNKKHLDIVLKLNLCGTMTDGIHSERKFIKDLIVKMEEDPYQIALYHSMCDYEEEYCTALSVIEEIEQFEISSIVRSGCVKFLMSNDLIIAMDDLPDRRKDVHWKDREIEHWPDNIDDINMDLYKRFVEANRNKTCVLAQHFCCVGTDLLKDRSVK